MRRRTTIFARFVGKVVLVFGIMVLGSGRLRAAEEMSQRWAILIGVNEYANVHSLKYCVADQEALAKQLIVSGFPKDQVYLLDDNAPKQKLRPSKLNIEKQLELVLGIPSPGDTIVLGFSGHGVQIGGKSYICPSDCDLENPQETMISLDKVYDELSACKASMKLLVVDACRNDLEIGGKRSVDSARSLRGFGESLEKPPEGISLLTSCSPGQFAREHEKLGQGVFMHFVLEGLQGKAADEDGVVRIGRLLDYTTLKTQKYVLEEFNSAQRPYYRIEGSGSVELARLDRRSLAAAAMKPGETIVNSIGMSLTLIPPGEFWMGSDESHVELEREFGNLSFKPSFNDEHPRHRVRISEPFLLGTYEVTNGQFRAFAEKQGYLTDAESNAIGGEGYDAKSKPPMRRGREFSWKKWGLNQTDQCPVANLSWNDAVAFCRWLSDTEGKKYRLPTEAEWEYSCRAGSTTRFVGGNSPNDLVRFGNVFDEGAKVYLPTMKTLPGLRDGFGFPAPVGRYRANAFGIYDMHGNVWEYCSDWYADNYYSTSATDDPQGPAQGVYRVLRGGGWNGDPVLARSSDRFRFRPDQSDSSAGFRVVREP